METLIFHNFTFNIAGFITQHRVFLQMEDDWVFCLKEIDLGQVKGEKARGGA